MAYSDQQIRDYAYKLQKAGAPLSDIEEFVKRAKQEQTQNTGEQNPTKAGVAAGLGNSLRKGLGIHDQTTAIPATTAQPPKYMVPNFNTGDWQGSVIDLKAKSDLTDQDKSNMAMQGLSVSHENPGNIPSNILDQAKTGILKGGEGVHKIGAAITGDTANLEGYRQFWGLTPEGQVDVRKLSRDERLLTGASGGLDVLGGGMQSTFSPMTGTIEATPVVNKAMEYGMGKFNEGTQFLSDHFKQLTGIDPNSEQGKVIDQWFNVAGQLGLLKVGESVAKSKTVQGAVGKVGEMATPYVEKAKQGTMNAIDTGLNVANDALNKGVQATGAVINKGIDATKQAGDWFGEKVKNTTLGKDAETLRVQKMQKGLKEQNTRLKTVNASFSENTKNYNNPDGTTRTVTPVDTLGKYKIYPDVENGAINMGDYKTSSGALGKLRGEIENLDSQIDTILKNTGAKIPLDDLWKEAVDKAKSNPELKQSGQVESTITKIDKRFGDYVNSYGNTVDIAELNNIRKVANKDWSPDTQDVSKIVGDIARDKVYNATEDLKVKELLRDQSELLSAKNYAQKLNGTKVIGGRMGNYAARTAGAVIGATVKNAPVIGPVLGMLGGEYIARALQKSQFVSPLAEIKGYFEGNKTEPSQMAKTTPKMEIKDVGGETTTAAKPPKTSKANNNLAIKGKK